MHYEDAKICVVNSVVNLRYLSFNTCKHSFGKWKNVNLKFLVLNLLIVSHRFSSISRLIHRFSLVAVSMDTDTCQHLYCVVAINQKQSQNKHTVT